MTRKTFLSLVLVLLSCGISAVFFHLCGSFLRAGVDQVAFPARAPSSHALFVDSGAFPDGIYRERHAFESIDQDITSRICGLFSSSATAGMGDVSMWIPMVHPIHGGAWRHCRLRRQLYSPNATQSLFSTHVATTQLKAVAYSISSSGIGER